MVKGGLTRESPSHISAEQSLEAVKLFEKYPGRSREAARAWAYLVENQDALAKVPEQSALVEQLSRIEPACEQYSYSTHLTLLMKDISVLPLSQKEKKRILTVLRNHFNDQNTDGQLSPLRMKANALKEYLDSVYDGDNKEALKPKAAALLAEFESAREALKPEMLALGAAGKGATLDYWAPELKLWKRLHESYRTLLAELVF